MLAAPHQSYPLPAASWGEVPFPAGFVACSRSNKCNRLSLYGAEVARQLHAIKPMQDDAQVLLCLLARRWTRARSSVRVSCNFYYVCLHVVSQ